MHGKWISSGNEIGSGSDSMQLQIPRPSWGSCSTSKGYKQQLIDQQENTSVQVWHTRQGIFKKKLLPDVRGDPMQGL